MYKCNISNLPKYFKGKGEVKEKWFTQIKETDRGFIYRINENDNSYYEVFEKRINSRFHRISYPQSKSFGIWAWTYHDIETAFKKLNQIDAK